VANVVRRRPAGDADDADRSVATTRAFDTSRRSDLIDITWHWIAYKRETKASSLRRLLIMPKGYDLKPEVLDTLASPGAHEPLRFVCGGCQGSDGGDWLEATQTSRRFPVSGGIPDFVDRVNVVGANKRYQKLYDKIAFIYDFQYWLWATLLRGGEAAVRKEYLDRLEIRPSDKVLEISVGTGSDLRFLSSEAAYFGLDISLGMLRKGQSNLKRWGRSAALICGEAESLPFKSGQFDVVFLVAGINFFNDKLAAIEEMIRVAKPGTRIVIVDATDKLNESYGKIPLARRFVDQQKGLMDPPIDLVPGEMREVELKHVCRGDFYCLSFRTPT